MFCEDVWMSMSKLLNDVDLISLFINVECANLIMLQITEFLAS